VNILCTVRHDRECRRLAARLLHAVSQRGMNRERVRAAVLFADGAHMGQLRRSGEPFLVHPLLVALLVLHMGGSEDDVIAALLHDASEDNPHISLTDIAMAWGRPVAQRVAALTKNTLIAPEFRMFDVHGRLLQAVAELGPGVAAIKVADRCHNSATSEALQDHKRQRLQLENQRFFAPLAHQIGARGLGQFLSADPAHWWRARSDFVQTLSAIQTPFLH
jgi:(p)ppGpp synthase/HD superfamily hydrolase